MRQILLHSLILFSSFYYGVSANPAAASCESFDFPQPPCCGVGATNKGRITYGTNVTINEFPWMVFLVNYNICGGSLINSRWVLTAAHCIYSALPQFLVLGTLTPWSEGYDRKLIKLKKAFIHEKYLPDYQNNLYDDIALLQLEKPVTFSNSIQPICLTSNIEENLDDREAVISGWGYTERYEPSPHLLKANVHIWKEQKCHKYKGYKNVIPDSFYQICASANPSSICGGDSGGPLMIYSKETNNYFQVGINSAAAKFCLADAPQIFVRVGNYMDWIKGIIAANP